LRKKRKSQKKFLLDVTVAMCVQVLDRQHLRQRVLRTLETNFGLLFYIKTYHRNPGQIRSHDPLAPQAQAIQLGHVARATWFCR
jgi:hypothetical protein